jgi:hypothetical protein
MVAEGIQLIDLCGGFSPVWTVKVIEAIDGAGPVGVVAYGARHQRAAEHAVRQPQADEDQPRDGEEHDATGSPAD